MLNRFCTLATLIVGLGLLSGSACAEPVTVDSPKALAAALKEARPGDVILLAPGEWKDAELKIRAVGTAEAPITVRAAAPGKTVFTGKSSLRLTGRHVVVDGLFFRDFVDEDHIIAFRRDNDDVAEDCRLTNTAFDRPLRASGEADTRSYHVSVYGRRNRVDHCTFGPKYTSAPTLTVWVNADGAGDDHRIDRNYFLGRPPLGKNGGETLRIGTSEVSLNPSRTIVEENYFRHCDGEAEIISNKSCDNVYRRNVFVECRGALVLRHGNRCTVEGNWFFGNGVEGTGGIRVIGEDHRIVNNYLERLMGRNFESAMPICDGIPNTPLNGYFRVQRLLIAHNTFVHCAESLTFGVGHGARNRVETATGVSIANNLFLSEHGPIVRFLSQPQELEWSGNIAWGADVGLSDPGVRVTDPLLRPGDPIHRPAEASPAVNAGATLAPPVPIDIDGQSRDATADAGCDESSDTFPAYRPVTAAEVGVRWPR